MSKIPPRIQQLIDRFLDETITPSEYDELNQWYDQHDELKLNEIRLRTDDVESAILQRINTSIDGESATLRSKSGFRSGFYRVAAAVLLLLTVGYFAADYRFGLFLFTNQPPQALTFEAPKNQAWLVLSDNSLMPMDSIQKQVSLIDYENKEVIDFSDLEVNRLLTAHGISETQTVVVPRGFQFKLVLPDGTLAWLNADSRISFPTRFDTDIREVSVSGEVYFDVISDRAHPFIVNTERQRIVVTGTKFNVSAYPDELAEVTTLFEGKVNVEDKDTGFSLALKPGQESVLQGQNLLARTNLRGATVDAWRSNTFVFEDENMGTILRRVSRWYDVEVDSGQIDDTHRFSGKIRKEAGLSEVLKMLNLVSNLEFQLSGNRLTVKL